MNIFCVRTADLTVKGQRWLINFETDARTVAELFQRLQDDRVIFGHTLRAKPSGEAGVLEVISRREIILGREAVYSIEVPDRKFVEYEA